MFQLVTLQDVFRIHPSCFQAEGTSDGTTGGTGEEADTTTTTTTTTTPTVPSPTLTAASAEEEEEGEERAQPTPPGPPIPSTLLHASSSADPAVTCVLQEINRRYANRVIPKLGLCIRAVDLLDWSAPVVLACQDGAYQRTVTFRALLFAPPTGTILTGRIKESSPQRGVRISLGFMDDIYVPPPYLMPNTTTFDPAEGLWVWTWDGNALYMDTGEWIRVRVEHEEWAGSLGGVGEAPFQLLCSMTEPGLGLLSWWEEDGEGEGDGDAVDAPMAEAS